MRGPSAQLLQTDLFQSFLEISELLSKMLNIRKVKHNVLNAKMHKKEAESSVRISFGKMIDQSNIDYLVSCLKQIISRLKNER